MKGTFYSWYMKFRFFEESKRVQFYFALTIRYMCCTINLWQQFNRNQMEIM